MSNFKPVIHWDDNLSNDRQNTGLTAYAISKMRSGRQFTKSISEAKYADKIWHAGLYFMPVGSYNTNNENTASTAPGYLYHINEDPDESATGGHAIQIEHSGDTSSEWCKSVQMPFRQILYLQDDKNQLSYTRVGKRDATIATLTEYKVIESIEDLNLLKTGIVTDKYAYLKTEAIWIKYSVEDSIDGLVLTWHVAITWGLWTYFGTSPVETPANNATLIAGHNYITTTGITLKLPSLDICPVGSTIQITQFDGIGSISDGNTTDPKTATLMPIVKSDMTKTLRGYNVPISSAPIDMVSEQDYRWGYTVYGTTYTLCRVQLRSGEIRYALTLLAEPTAGEGLVPVIVAICKTETAYPFDNTLDRSGAELQWFIAKVAYVEARNVDLSSIVEGATWKASAIHFEWRKMVSETVEYDILPANVLDAALYSFEVSETSNGTKEWVLTHAIENVYRSTDLSGLKKVAYTANYHDLVNIPVIDTELSYTSTNAVQNKAIRPVIDDTVNIHNTSMASHPNGFNHTVLVDGGTITLTKGISVAHASTGIISENNSISFSAVTPKVGLSITGNTTSIVGTTISGVRTGVAISNATTGIVVSNATVGAKINTASNGTGIKVANSTNNNCGISVFNTNDVDKHAGIVINEQFQGIAILGTTAGLYIEGATIGETNYGIHVENIGVGLWLENSKSAAEIQVQGNTACIDSTLETLAKINGLTITGIRGKNLLITDAMGNTVSASKCNVHASKLSCMGKDKVNISLNVTQRGVTDNYIFDGASEHNPKEYTANVLYVFNKGGTSTSPLYDHPARLQLMYFDTGKKYLYTDAQMVFNAPADLLSTGGTMGETDPKYTARQFKGYALLGSNFMFCYGNCDEKFSIPMARTYIATSYKDAMDITAGKSMTLATAVLSLRRDALTCYYAILSQNNSVVWVKGETSNYVSNETVAKAVGIFYGTDYAAGKYIPCNKAIVNASGNTYAIFHNFEISGGQLNESEVVLDGNTYPKKTVMIGGQLSLKCTGGDGTLGVIAAYGTDVVLPQSYTSRAYGAVVSTEAYYFAGTLDKTLFVPADCKAKGAFIIAYAPATDGKQQFGVNWITMGNLQNLSI